MSAFCSIQGFRENCFVLQYLKKRRKILKILLYYAGKEKILLYCGL